MNNTNQDVVIFVHICHNKSFFGIVEPDYFSSKPVKELYKITKSYVEEFGTLPFTLGSTNVEQLKQYVQGNGIEIKIDELATNDENLSMFLSSSQEIVSYPYESIDKAYLTGKDGKSGTFGHWLKLSSFVTSLNKATKYLKLKRDTGELKGDNVTDVVNKCMNIINDGGNVSVTNNDGYSFHDPKGHIQTPPENLIKTGYSIVDTWLGYDGKPGGLEPGTLTMLWGLPNIGKSIWLGNLSANMHTAGFNVLMVSNEMKENKIIRRLGSNLFDININKYSEFAEDPFRVGQVIDKYKNEAESMLCPWGTLWIVKIPKCTPSQVEYKARELAKKLGINWHAIVIDYFTNMGNDHGISPDNMYSYHKSNADDLFTMAGVNDWAVVTAHQLKIGAVGMDDITLETGSESSGITHATDNIWGIIQGVDHKSRGIYLLKNLKSREGEFKDYVSEFNVVYKNMRISGTKRNTPPDDLLI